MVDPNGGSKWWVQMAGPNGCAAILEAGVQMDPDEPIRCFQTFESNVLFALRFMVDTQIVGGNWVSFPHTSKPF